MSALLSTEIPQSPVPEVLYKYYSPERISVLESMELRFTKPSEFNDTFDSHYLIPSSQGAKGKVARTLLRNRLGIFCLTERADNHLMWVHYAMNDTGFVLGFNARARFFQDDNRILRKVIYQKGPRVFSDADMNVCFYKSDEWKYEREWRCVRSFEVSESRAVGIEPDLISHIIFGSRMEAWQIARIMRMELCPNCEGNGYLMHD